MLGEIVLLCLFPRTAYGQDENFSCTGEWELRLSGGRHSGEGRLELCSGGVWGTVCNINWDLVDARTACAQLDFNANFTAWTAYFSVNTSQPVHIKNVECTGAENSLANCATEPANSTCNHLMDVGLICTEYTPTACNEGQVRLVGGSSADEGRVEYCIGGQWGTICKEDWDRADASIVCTQLDLTPYGHDSPIIPTDSKFSSATAQGSSILMSGVQCRGNESSLSECPRAPTISQCSHATDAGIRCQCPNEMAVRVVDGSQENKGRVEYCIEGQWDILCNSAFPPKAGEVVCREIGYNIVPNKTVELITNDYEINNGYRTRTDSLKEVIYPRGFNCEGTESALSQCPTYAIESPFPRFGPCFSFGIGILCPLPNEPRECENGDIRLVGSVFAQLGNVEVCNNHNWRAVCERNWDDKDAKVACRQLGYESGIAVHQGVFGLVTDSTFQFTNLQCKGNESSLFDCPHGETLPCPFLRNSAGVICSITQDGLYSPKICDDGLFNSTIQPEQNEAIIIGELGFKNF